MIAVIIVNYGTAGLVIEAVTSVLERDHGDHDVELHVVDNASPGEDAARLAEAHETGGWGARVTLWPETENHGFGRGNNVVLAALAERAVPPEYVFLLNPDAKLENEALAILAEALSADPGAAAAGAGIALPDGTPVTAAFRFPGFTSEVVQTSGLGVLDRLFARRRVPLSPDLPATEVAWVAGAAVMFRFSALRAVGFFDPAFFLYFEEVDLMRRLSEAGWRIRYVPDARVLHHEGAATDVKSNAARRRRPAYVYRSWRYYFVKTHGRAYALVTAFAVQGAGVVNALVARLRGRTPKTPEHFFTDHWRHVLWPLITGRPKGAE